MCWAATGKRMRWRPSSRQPVRGRPHQPRTARSRSGRVPEHPATDAVGLKITLGPRDCGCASCIDVCSVTALPSRSSCATSRLVIRWVGAAGEVVAAEIVVRNVVLEGVRGDQDRVGNSGDRLLVPSAGALICSYWARNWVFLVRAAPLADSIRTARRYGLPLRVWPERRLRADSSLPSGRGRSPPSWRRRGLK